MKSSTTQDGLTLRVIAGTTNVILGIDLQENKRGGCLGFSIERTDLGPANGNGPAAAAEKRWLPNMLRFPSDKNDKDIRTDRAPLQKFRWGDYTTKPGNRYRYRVVARRGKPGALTPDLNGNDGVSVEITTEDNKSPETAVFFNRGAAASKAFNDKFPAIKKEGDLLGSTPLAVQAREWLSRGLQEALLAFMSQAKDKTFALHAAVYEFQKPELLKGLKEAADRKADVKVLYHCRQKKAKGQPDPKDKTATENQKAAAEAGIANLCVQRKSDPQDAIMHDKFVVLLKKEGGAFKPKAVWTGSTNWTDGGIYGQLNVGHAIYDLAVAEKYEALFQLLHADSPAPALKKALEKLAPAPLPLPGGHQIIPVFSPQSKQDMLSLYADICTNATCLMVSAPFELHEKIRKALENRPRGTLHFLLLDTKKSLGNPEEIEVQEGDPRNKIAAATTLKSPLHDFQGKILEGKEGFMHAGIHIHSKIIAADPFSSDPILVTGSANFSSNSTVKNDSNSLVIRGNTSVADIYATEFMRMFEHYHFRASEAASGNKPLGLAEDDTWSDKYYKPGSNEELDRRLFAGTLV